MSNITAVIIYILFAMLTAGSGISILAKKTKVAEEKLYVLLALMILGWTFTYIIWDLTDDPAKLRFIYCLFYPFIAFVPTLLLFLVCRFFLVDHKLPRPVVALLIIFPVLITLMSVTGNAHNLIFERFEVLEVYPYRSISIEYGKGFWLHTAFCYTVTMASAIMVIYFFFKAPKYNRYSLMLFAGGIITSLVGNVFTLLHLFPVAFDPTVIFTNISAAFYYFAVINNSRTVFINFSRQAVFDSIHDTILILDPSQYIVDCNAKARRWLEEYQIKADSLQEVLGHFTRTERIVEDNPLTDYACEKDGKSHIFELQTTEIFNDRKYLIGHIATFRDVTQTRLLQNKLEKKAGIDALTGLNNRHAYTGAARRLDAKLYLPLSVIMCDLNGLKEVNDKYGHSEGDKMLLRAAEILEAHCPRGSFLSRIGGDEFVYLLPGTPAEEAEALLASIQAGFERASAGAPYPIGMAMGCATKYMDSDDYEKVVALADKKMYHNKTVLKGTRNA